jgi:hypothetical protein
MFHKLSEDQELEIAAARERAKAGWRKVKRVLFWLAMIVLGSFLYFAGEKAGLESCRAWQEIMHPPK